MGFLTAEGGERWGTGLRVPQLLLRQSCGCAAKPCGLLLLRFPSVLSPAANPFRVQLGTSLFREEPLPYLVYQPLPWQIQCVTQSRRSSRDSEVRAGGAEGSARRG